jgi:hypothetical protein
MTRAILAALALVINYDLMLQEMLGRTSGKVGQVIYWGRPQLRYRLRSQLFWRPFR